jgi:hypothetical protein
MLLFMAGFALTYGLASGSHVMPDTMPKLKAQATWQADVAGLNLRYHIVDLRGYPTLGYVQADWETRTCLIYIDAWLLETALENQLEVVLHEVGHCIDLFVLGFDHNGFRDEGCLLGEYFCDAAEGYAESWRYAYTLSCGLDPHAVGYHHTRATYYAVSTRGNAEPRQASCTFPDPRSVTVDKVATFSQRAEEYLQAGP